MRLTQRDLSLLALLCRNTVMSFEEVRLFAFEGRHKATVCNRLTKLERMTLLRRINVGNFIYKRNMRSVGVVIQITKRGIEILRRCELFDERWKAEPVPVNIQSLIHDLELNQAVRGISERLPHAAITNGKHLLKDGSAVNAKIPDALLELAARDLEEAKRIGIVGMDSAVKGAAPLRVAIELELTTKSDRRYREIITGYRLSREVDRVLYLSNDMAVFRKIQSVLAGFPIKGEIQRHSGIFSFLTLSAVAPKHDQRLGQDVSGSGGRPPGTGAAPDKIEAGNVHQKLSEVS
jgi:hypothetical protein